MHLHEYNEQHAVRIMVMVSIEYGKKPDTCRTNNFENGGQNRQQLLPCCHVARQAALVSQPPICHKGEGEQD